MTFACADCLIDDATRLYFSLLLAGVIGLSVRILRARSRRAGRAGRRPETGGVD